METPQFRPWEDIQPELLGLILMRLSCLADRVRMRAVCPQWRCNGLLQPRPLPFPCLTLPDGTFLSISDSNIYRMPVPADTSCQSSIDNWLFLVHTDGSCSLLDPFSKTRLELPNVVSVWQHERHYRSDPNSLSYKLVVPLPLDLSPDSFVAALIRDRDMYITLRISKSHTGTYTFKEDKGPLQHLCDVVLFDGKLYVVSQLGRLFILEFCKDLGGNLNIKCVINSFGDNSGLPEYLPEDDLYMSEQYLVECGGKLLSVRRLLRDVGVFSWETNDVSEHFQTAGFDILEADLGSNTCQWRKASDFDGHALFLSRYGSKSLPVGEFSVYQEDCIYFMCDYYCPSSMDPLCDSGVFNIKSCTITPLISGTIETSLHCHGQWRPAWVFPS